MDSFDSDNPAPRRRPRTLTVLVLLALAALSFSYLAAYAVPVALVEQRILPPWPADTDPRPQWMVRDFAGALGALITIGISVRFLSRRQLRDIDSMADEEN